VAGKREAINMPYSGTAWLFWAIRNVAILVAF
jgi:hypothetical protein